MTPVLGIFNLIGSICYTSTQSDLPPLSADKIGLSLSHLVPEITCVLSQLAWGKLFE